MIPFDPNGVPVDLLRACYTTLIRPFYDNPYTEPIRWYFVDEAPFLAGGTRFASGNYAHPDLPWPGVGEVLGAPRPFAPGDAPFVAPIRAPAGDPSYFHHGAPWSARGTLPRSISRMPLPCAGGDLGLFLGGGGILLTAISGLLLGGDGIFTLDPFDVGDGGEEWDADVLPGLLVGDGGADWNGHVGAALGVGDGGAEWNAEVLLGVPAGDGGAEWNAQVLAGVPAGDGGAEWDGALQVDPQLSDGGEEWDGGVVPGVALSDGGEEWDGTSGAALFSGDGGAEWDGELLAGVATEPGGEEWNGEIVAGVATEPGGEEWNASVWPELVPAGDGGASWDGEAPIGLPAGDGGAEWDGLVVVGLVAGDGGDEWDGESGAALGSGDGGIEFNADGSLGLPVGDGATEWNGEAQQNPVPVPGTTCLAAATIPLGADYTYSIPGVAAEHWFLFSGAGGAEYKLVWTINSGMPSRASLLTGTCAALSEQVALLTTGCGSFTLAASGTVFVRIIGPVIGAANYTVRVGTGPCP